MPALGNALDFAKYEGRNLRAHQLGAAPSSPVTGQLYYNTADNTLYWWDGTTWQSAKGGAPGGAAGGDLDLTYPNPQIRAGVIVNADVNAAAAIAYSKLLLTNSIVNADVNTAAAIAWGKINSALAIINADVALAAGIVYSKLNLTNSIVNADIAAGAAIALSKLAVDPLARANHTGTQLANTISNFDTQVRTNRLDQMAAPTADVSHNNTKITNLGDPTADADAANKRYVDSQSQGLDAKASVRVASVATVTIASPGASIDTIALAAGDRVLLKDQGGVGVAHAANGIYVWNGAAVPMTRAADMDAWTEVPGAYTWVEQGGVNADSAWVSTADQGGTLGTTVIPFVQFSGAAQIIAGAGLTKSVNTLDVGAGAGITVNADSVQIANNGVTNAMIADGAVDLATADVTGTLPFTKGGTGQITAEGRARDRPARRGLLQLGDPRRRDDDHDHRRHPPPARHPRPPGPSAGRGDRPGRAPRRGRGLQWRRHGHLRRVGGRQRLPRDARRLMPKAVNDLTVSNRLVMPGSLAVERSVAQHRAFRNVASLDTGASATVGAIVVQTKITGSVMFRAHLQGYHYQSTTDRLLDSVVVGYATSGPVVSRSGVVHYGPSQPVVQVGFNASGELAIILAGIAAIWNYFRLHVPLAVLGYSAPTEAMAAGWTVTQATDLSPWTTGFATVPSITPGAAPTGSATGDLSGSYPAPVVAKASGASFDLPAATVQRFTGKPAATTDIIRSQVGAEAQNRLVVQADGRHTWGDGAAAGDTNLYRSGPDQLKTDDALEVAGLLQLNSGLLIPAGAGAGKVLTSDASGNATWDDPDLAEYALGTTTAAVVSLLTGAWIKVPAGVVTTETPDAASCLRWNSDGTITILQDGWYSFYALFERGGATNAGVQWGFWYNSSDVSPANPAAFWRNELPAQTYYIDQASMCWRFSAGQRVGVSAYNRSATTYTATVMLSVARIGAGVEGPKGDKGDPGITDYAFKPGNWCDQLTGVLANTWVTLPTKSGATPRQLSPQARS